MDSLQSVLDALHVEARQYFVPEGLPSAPKLRALLSRFDGKVWKKASGTERFFLVLLLPDFQTQAPAEDQCAAFVEAAASLPGDWWEFGNAKSSAALRAWRNLPCAQVSWVGMLKDEREFHMVESEAATLAGMNQWEVGDLAAMILSRELGLPFDRNAAVQNRRAARLSMASQVKTD